MTAQPRLKNGERARAGRSRRRKVNLNTSGEPWSAAEELRLQQLAGHVQVRELARILTDEFGVPRTRAAVCIRARLLGLSLWWDGYSQNQVAELFGVWFKTVEHWRAEGLLRAEPWPVGRGRFGQWHFTDREVYTFIDRCTWAYDAGRMRPGPLRTRAEVAHRARPWLTAEQVATLWGVNVRTLREWVTQGRIPHKRRRAGCGLPKMMIAAADLPGLRQELRAQALSNLRTAVAERDRRRKARIAA